MKDLSFLVLIFFGLSACAPEPELSKANKKIAGFQAQNVTGSWSWNGRSESSGYLATIQTENKVQFQLEIMRGAPSYNHGSIDGEFNLNGNVGIFQTNEYGTCEIIFDFKTTKVILSQPPEKADCGFGHGVYAHGSYTLNSHNQPKF